MAAFTILSALVYLLLWRLHRLGKHVTLILLGLQFLFYVYATVPTDSFYKELVERNIGVTLVGDVDVRWGWASRAFAFPNIYSDRAVDVLIVSDAVDISSTRKELWYSSSRCTINSSKVRTLYGAGAMAHCWKGRSSSGRDDVYLTASHDYKTIYFWQR